MQQHPVVLGGSIDASDNPVDDERSKEPFNVRPCGFTGHNADQIDDLRRGGPTVTLILEGRRHAECLAQVLLVDPFQDTVITSSSVEAFDGNG